MLTKYQKTLILRACEYRTRQAVESAALGEPLEQTSERAERAVDAEIKKLAENIHVSEAEIRSVISKN